MNKKDLNKIKNIIKTALKEDIGSGDITTKWTIPSNVYIEGEFIAKDEGIIGGLEVAKETFKLLSSKTKFLPLVKEGTYVKKGTILARVKGRAHDILPAERTALNFMQRMSGIATATKAYVQAVKNTKAIIMDTRKTAPGLRLLDKWAVRMGGGENHRLGLFDMVLIKENHIESAGGITNAVKRVRKKNKKVKIEVEVKNLDELREALELNVDRILLDNMTIEQLREAVSITNGKVKLEASGNITLKNVAEIGSTGVDMISIGSLTHSVKALDISFLVKK